MASKGRRTCGKPNGHADAADKRTQGLEAEIARVNDKYNELLLERGPRCVHPQGTADERNVILIEAYGKSVAKLNARILELEAQLAPYLAADRAAIEARRKKSYR